jgi:hypothetical protein
MAGLQEPAADIENDARNCTLGKRRPPLLNSLALRCKWRYTRRGAGIQVHPLSPIRMSSTEASSTPHIQGASETQGRNLPCPSPGTVEAAGR